MTPSSRRSTARWRARARRRTGERQDRLLAELCAGADRLGHVVLSGGASELERERPFALFVDALDEYLHGLEPRRLAELDADVLTALAPVFPSLHAPDGAGAERVDHRFHAHRAARRLLEAPAAVKPLVLLLDDVHWADSGSIEPLGTLLRRPPAAPVLSAVALRPRQLPERLAGALERADAIASIELRATRAALRRTQSPIGWR